MSYPRITGENLDYLYNRDSNTKNFDLDGSFTPNYGTSVSVTNRIGEIVGRDYYSSKYPIGLNGMTIEVQMMFKDITDGQAGVIMAAVNSRLSEDGTGVGYITLGSNDSTPIATGECSGVYFNLEDGEINPIYNNISGLYIAEYDDSHKENLLHDLSLTLKTNNNSAYINYWGLYPNTSGILYWDTGVAYNENDIVFYPAFENARDNFFYCLSGHTSTNPLSPVTSSQAWTQSFMWAPDHTANVSNNGTSELERFGEGVINRIKTNKNEQYINTELTFSYRSNSETKAMLHFLENRMGYKKFDFTMSGIYRSKKKFTAAEWRHEFIYYDVNNISVRIMESSNVAPSRELNTTNFWNVL
jgi:phage-related protein